MLNNSSFVHEKEKGFINGIGKKIVTECHVGEEVFSRLIEEYGDDE